MYRGFRDFLMRGNIVDLAIAVVIGTAFTAVVKVFTDSLIQPLINLVLGGGVSGGKVRVNGQVFDFGAVLNALIFFVITAAVVYFLIVVPMNHIIERRRRGDADAPTPMPSDEAVLLTQIRDLLSARQL